MLKANYGLDPLLERNKLQFRVDDFEEDLILTGPGLTRKYQISLLMRSCKKRSCRISFTFAVKSS